MPGPIPIVIADGDAASAAALCRQLATQADLSVRGYAGRAEEALVMVGEFKPAILILDLTTMRDQAFRLLEQLESRTGPDRPRTVVLTAFGHEQETQRCVDLGADYYVLKPPAAGALADRVRRLAAAGTEEEAAAPPVPQVAERETWMARASGLSRDLGIPSHIKGSLYLREAAVACAGHPALLDAVTKELYPLVAEACDTTAARVERAIRHAIEVGWRSGPPAAAHLLLGVAAVGSRERPTNSALIAAMAEALRIGPDQAVRHGGQLSDN